MIYSDLTSAQVITTMDPSHEGQKDWAVREFLTDSEYNINSKAFVDVFYTNMEKPVHMYKCFHTSHRRVRVKTIQPNEFKRNLL